jgi:hypothetical protein
MRISLLPVVFFAVAALTAAILGAPALAVVCAILALAGAVLAHADTRNNP